MQASKQQASEQVQAAAAVIKHYHHQGETWKPKYQILKKCVELKKRKQYVHDQLYEKVGGIRVDEPRDSGDGSSNDGNTGI